jgi:preprotein translocase subunit SecE
MAKDKKTSSGDVKKTNKVKQYFVDLKNDWKQLKWPKKRELANNTLTVITTIIIIGIFVAVLDYGLLQLMDLLLNRKN